MEGLLEGTRSTLRTEPEIDTERKKYLAERRNITPDIKKGIYPCFYSEPGVDLLLVTPLNQTVSPLNLAFNTLFQDVFKGCLNPITLTPTLTEEWLAGNVVDVCKGR